MNAQLLAADSFRVRLNPKTGAAEVRGWARHRSRFTRAVREATPGAAGRENEGRILDRANAFLDDALPRIAAYGAGFPRLELWSDASGTPALRLSLRPVPELRDTVELRTAGAVRLAHPGRKGPNIARLSELNRELGAEALLLDSDGRVLEGATTSLVWWTDDTDESGCTVAAPSGTAPNRVASVTEALLRDAAQKRPVGRMPNDRRSGSFSESGPTAAELTSHEVWAVNALHGIRTVTSINGVALPSPVPQRLAWFREALDRTWEAIEG